MIPGGLLTWALVALSLANTILLLWLGMTLWLNADRRNLGIAVTAGGFVLGSLFFMSHSALLLSDSLAITRGNTLWLAIGITPVVILPFAWYVVVLWYAGFWTWPAGALRHRHRLWVWLTGAALVAGLGCQVLLGIPHVPGASSLTPAILPVRQLIKAPLAGIPLVALAYPIYVVICVLLSLDALRKPGSTSRLLGDLARRRAQPWLVAASILLVVVGLLVAAVVVWTVTNAHVGGTYVLDRARLQVIGRADLVISLLITAVVILLGQAITSYELFTGKSLPRRTLARQWHGAIALAAGYGVLMGGALTWGLEPVYAVLATALLMTVFFALLSWRYYVEWEHSARQLRPFVTRTHWYDSLVAGPDGGESNAEPFAALCEQVLNASLAYLAPFGPTAAFVQPQSYPPERPVPGTSSLPPLPGEGETPLAVVDPLVFGGASWAVPLRGERGLMGALLLGPRRDRGLYTREEIEIARSVGERLLDSAASLELSRRLMRLQRERMATTQHLDQRTRRVLHDEVLPLIHTSMLNLAAGSDKDSALRQLSDAHQQVSNLLRDLPSTTTPDVARLGLLPALRKMVEVEFASSFDTVEWHCEPAVERHAAQLGSLATETLYYATRELVRNAAKHARSAESADALCLSIHAAIDAGRFELTIADNGRGAARAAANGHGLELHSTLMAIAGGSLAIETIPGRWTRAQLTMPLHGQPDLRGS